jgi:hypothetical protein
VLHHTSDRFAPVNRVLPHHKVFLVVITAPQHTRPPWIWVTLCLTCRTKLVTSDPRTSTSSPRLCFTALHRRFHIVSRLRAMVNGLNLYVSAFTEQHQRLPIFDSRSCFGQRGQFLQFIPYYRDTRRVARCFPTLVVWSTGSVLPRMECSLTRTKLFPCVFRTRYTINGRSLAPQSGFPQRTQNCFLVFPLHGLRLMDAALPRNQDSRDAHGIVPLCFASHYG